MKLRTGVTAATATDQLEQLRRDLEAPRSARDEAISQGSELSLKVNSYLGWAQKAEQLMRYLFIDADALGGIFTNRYWHIAGLPAASPYGHRIIDQEIEHQSWRLGGLIDTVESWKRLGQRPGELLALDTNAWLQFRLYPEIPWLIISGSSAVRLILAMPVLDEIESKKYGENRRLKKRARKILPLIDKAFGDESHEYVDVERDGKKIAGVTLEILRDPTGFGRSSNDMDAEFLDRCEFLQQATGRPVTIVTADTGMKIRARGRFDTPKLLNIPDEYRLGEADDEAPEGAAQTA